MNVSQLTVTETARARIPTEHGEFDLVHFLNSQDNKDHLALVYGDITSTEPTLTRIHSSCITGEAFGSLRCDCGEQLNRARQAIVEHGSGIIVYLHQEGRGIGIENKLRAYQLQDQGLNTLEANRALGLPDDLRDYAIAAGILRLLDIQSVALMTNNRDKVIQLQHYGVNVVEVRPMPATINKHNTTYLMAKVQHMNHNDALIAQTQPSEDNSP